MAVMIVRRLLFMLFCLLGLAVPDLVRFGNAASTAFAQQSESPLDILLKRERARSANIIVVPNARPRRALSANRVQRAPKRVQRRKQAAPISIDAIIRASEPALSPVSLSAQGVGILRQPPLPGLMAARIAAPAAASGAAPPGIAPASRLKKLLVIGDSLGIQLGQGLREALADRPDIIIDSRARADTGLVNTSVRDWPLTVSDVIAQPADRPDLVIALIGANDNQKLRSIDGGLADQLSESWRFAYAQRVDGIVLPLKRAGIPLIWVGLPVMKNTRLSGALLAINGIFQERVEREGGRYIDIWDQFADAAGGYSINGPDIAGEIQRMRAGDGVHFTKAGSRKLAFFVEQDVRKALSSGGADVDLANLPADVDAQVKAENAPANSLDAGLISPESELAPAFPIKPASGPIITLTAQPVASSLVPVSQRPQLRPPVEEVLRAGKAPYPKPGRGDDFSWPR
jgi:uncharacterized protein